MGRPAGGTRWAAALALAGLCLLAQGCASLARSAAADFAGNLSAAILNQSDPVLVRDSLPAYLLILDSLAAEPGAGPDVLGAAARLYAAYAVVFVDDPARSASLASRARDYGRRALCAANTGGCDLDGLPLDQFSSRLDRLAPSSADALLAYAVGSLAYLRTHSDDWQALTDLPRVERALERLLAMGAAGQEGTVNTYLGVLNSLRPPALGGQPERGRAYFEKAIEATGGRDLSAKVEYARNYARLVYDRELHDRLLGEVLAADPVAPGLTLFNTLARQQAQDLLATADEYF